jgi:hypothetical protein
MWTDAEVRMRLALLDTLGLLVLAAPAWGHGAVDAEGLEVVARSDSVVDLRANEETLGQLLTLGRARLRTLEQKISILRDERHNAEESLETHGYLEFIGAAGLEWGWADTEAALVADFEQSTDQLERAGADHWRQQAELERMADTLGSLRAKVKGILAAEFRRSPQLMLGGVSSSSFPVAPVSRGGEQPTSGGWTCTCRARRECLTGACAAQAGHRIYFVPAPAPRGYPAPAPPEEMRRAGWIEQPSLSAAMRAAGGGDRVLLLPGVHQPALLEDEPGASSHRR